MGGVIAVVLLAALFGFAVWRVAKSWRATSRTWKDTPRGDAP